MIKYVSLLAILLQLCSGSEQKQSDEGTATIGREILFVGEVQFHEAGNDLVTIDIALADNDMSRSQGLMDVRFLKPNGGMLFVFDVQERLNFWMASTPLSLDLIFADEDKSIVHVHHNAIPFSRQGIDSLEPAKYVIEVNAGFALKYDIKPGNTYSYTLH
jgi:uncharacterized membrane protein (UPF0127 family)